MFNAASQGLLTSILGAGFAVAFLHAGLPTHWLPFVLAARGQGWSRTRTMAVTAGAGLGHVLFTAALGVLVVWVGLEASDTIGRLFPLVAGTVLIAFGLFYLARQARGAASRHHRGKHRPCFRDEPHDRKNGHAHQDEPPRAPTTTDRRRRSDTAVVAGLFVALTLSPCEAFLPVYLSGIAYGWAGFVMLSLVLTLATLSGMVLFTWATLTGLERITTDRLERYESGMLGGLLCLLGFVVIVFEP